jgi:hypothetical protein
MPLDTNIALGVRPVEQPNMLAQMGQMMALRGAQQEYEGNNALRDAFASGGNLSDPAFVQRLRAANPKMAFDIESKYLAGEKTRSELLGSAYKNSREALTMVNSPESLRAYTVSQFSDPVIGPALKARGITPETAVANLDKEIATSGFNTVLKKSAMGLDSFFKDETSRRNTDVSSGPGYMNAGIARERLTMEQAEQANIARILRGEPPISIGGAPVAPMTGGGGGVAPMTYLWSTNPIQNSSTISALAEGTYTVTVIDANGCSISRSVNFDDPFPLRATSSQRNVSCFGSCDGQIIVTAIPGTGTVGINGYEYRIFGPGQSGTLFT